MLRYYNEVTKAYHVFRSLSLLMLLSYYTSTAKIFNQRFLMSVHLLLQALATTARWRLGAAGRPSAWRAAGGPRSPTTTFRDRGSTRT